MVVMFVSRKSAEQHPRLCRDALRTLRYHLPNSFAGRDTAVLRAINKVDRKPGRQPDRQPDPGIERQAEHQENRGRGSGGRDKPYRRGPEGTHKPGLTDTHTPWTGS